MVAKKETSDRNQIGVPTGENPALREAFRKIVDEQFGSDMAKFLRGIVCEVVATYGKLERSEAIKLDLGTQLYGGPALVRRVYRDWTNQHPDVERDVQAELKREKDAKKP